MDTATIAATTAQRVLADFRAYLACHVGDIEQLSAKQRRRLRRIITRALVR